MVGGERWRRADRGGRKVVGGVDAWGLPHTSSHKLTPSVCMHEHHQQQHDPTQPCVTQPCVTQPHQGNRDLSLLILIQKKYSPCIIYCI